MEFFYVHCFRMFVFEIYFFFIFFLLLVKKRKKSGWKEARKMNTGFFSSWRISLFFVWYFILISSDLFPNCYDFSYIKKWINIKMTPITFFVYIVGWKLSSSNRSTSYHFYLNEYETNEWSFVYFLNKWWWLKWKIAAQSIIFVYVWAKQKKVKTIAFR